MTFDELASNASILIIAGSETTATLLSAATFFLLKNPETLAKLTEEVRSAYTSENEIDLVNTQSLKYLQAVLEESLRVYPPVASGQGRKIARGGDHIAGQFVPEDVSKSFTTH
jgi:cytochrome P450